MTNHGALRMPTTEVHCRGYGTTTNGRQMFHECSTWNSDRSGENRERGPVPRPGRPRSARFELRPSSSRGISGAPKRKSRPPGASSQRAQLQERQIDLGQPRTVTKVCRPARSGRRSGSASKRSVKTSTRSQRQIAHGFAKERRLPLSRFNHRQRQLRTNDFQGNRRRSSAGTQIDPSTGRVLRQTRAAASGSISRRSSVLSLGGSSRSAVRLMVRFQRVSRRKYASIWSISGSR